MFFVPCSAVHKSCSRAHSALVRSYQQERQRQEIINDDQYPENKQKLITFKQWLITNKREAYK